MRVGEVVSDSGPPQEIKLVEQRLDETEIGTAKFAALTEIALGGQPVPDDLAGLLALDLHHPALLDHDVFASIYNKGKLALLTSWRDRRSAELFDVTPLASVGRLRHRIVRIIRDYSMFDRRESPQYYPDIARP